MKIKIDKNEYELKTNLFTVKIIQKEFKKPFISLVEEIAEMGLEEQIRFILCGTKEEDREKLENDIMGNWGLGDIFDNLKTFIEKIQYPGLTDEEIEEKNLKNLEQYEKAKKTGLVK